MLDRANDLRENVVRGRWVVETRLRLGVAMREPFLEITFRHGRPFAAYFYLPQRLGEKSYRTRRVKPGLVIDFNRAGRAIGIEITAPGELTLAQFNRALREIGAAPITRAELAPLLAA